MHLRKRNVSILGSLKHSFALAFLGFKPQNLKKNPTMCLVSVAALICSFFYFYGLLMRSPPELAFEAQISAWLWATVFFSNYAQALAEGRGRDRARALKSQRTEILATRLLPCGKRERVRAQDLRRNDLVEVIAGETIPADGSVVEGAALVDESAMTGESGAVMREAGGDRTAVTEGTRLLSDRIVAQVTADPGHSFLDRMISLIEGVERKPSPNEIALGTLLLVLTFLFLIVVSSLSSFASFLGVGLSFVVLLSLLVCLCPTTIGALMPAIGIAGMDRLIQKNVIAFSGHALEAAGDVDIILLDKTGTITVGRRQATQFLPVPGVAKSELLRMAFLASIFDLTPEGQSIVAFARAHGIDESPGPDAHAIPFTAHTRLSGLELSSTHIRKGAVDAVLAWVKNWGGACDGSVWVEVKRISCGGGTPMLVATQMRVLGVIELKDELKPGICGRFKQLRQLGIKTVMITGDNPETAKSIAAEAGLDHFFAEAKPEDKLKLIEKYQSEGHVVAMTGDGTNDAPALAQADVGLVMNTGTQEAREAGNVIDLDSDPSKIIEIIKTGKQLLLTRGALTTFSLANDVSKYFALVPAMFSDDFPELIALNVMNLKTPHSAILAAVMFNALVVVALIPLALRGVGFRAKSPERLLLKNIFIYGLGGVTLPFLGIKVLDIAIIHFGLLPN